MKKTTRKTEAGRMTPGGDRPMSALLVYPRFPVTCWGFQYALRLIGKRASLPPLGLITVAALLPSHRRLRLVDLNLQDLGPAVYRPAIREQPGLARDTS